MLKLYSHSGFSMKFDNGVIVSVQFGWASHCSNSHREKMLDTEIESDNAELAIYYEKHGREIWLTKRFAASALALTITDDMIGFATPKMIAKAMIWAVEYEKGA